MGAISNLVGYFLPSSHTPVALGQVSLSWLSSIISIVVVNFGVSDAPLGWMGDFADFWTLDLPRTGVHGNLMALEPFG